ncbi:MAG TPA: Uma2 family endonuclease [Rugosimonospora sp.]|nr:Uma2 family endonuclease [Rugosimonospora sp.]
MATGETDPAFRRVRPITATDLAIAPDDGRRWELLDGGLVVSAPRGLLHQRAVLGLAIVLREACPPEFEVVVGPFSVVLASDTVLAPDLFVARRDQLTERNLPGPPELAVEVTSPFRKELDFEGKKEFYERFGTPYFWAVDPGEGPEDVQLVAMELDKAGRYRRTCLLGGSSRFVTTSPYPVTVVPATLVV